MKAVIQRVNWAQVEVEQKRIARIEKGILLFLAIEKEDNKEKAQKLLDKVLHYRIFPDENQKLNTSLTQIAGELLVVSQFTLAANTAKGLRPSFSPAAKPELAQILYQHFVELAQKQHGKVVSGKFAANMQVTLQNDGPLTFYLTL